MDLLNIRRAFEKKLVEITPATVDNAFENVSFKPNKNKPYQRSQLSPRLPENPSFGDNYYREVGEFQIFLCFPLNQGAGAVYEHASLIQDTFFRGFSMEENGTVVTVRLTPSIQGAVIIDDRYCVPVIIDYFASILKS